MATELKVLSEPTEYISLTSMETEEPRVQDAAMSLCALGRSRSASPESPDSDANAAASSRDGDVARGCGGPSKADSSAPSLYQAEMNLHLENRLRISDFAPPPPPSSSSTVVSPPGPTRKEAPKKAARGGGAAKYSVKPKDPKRDTSVPFDEMKRLMRVYGSLKCLRNRTPVDSGRSAKVESIKRKFYRWFPDLEERFDRTPEGWYRPKAGHEEEMKHREAMRKEDQESLVRKRNSKRSSSKSGAHALV